MKPFTDIELFAAIKENNKGALSDLFLRYYEYLQHYGLQITANHIYVEESIQELFIYIFESHDRLSDIKNVKAYLYCSLRNRLIEKLGKQRRKRELDRDYICLTNIQFSNEDILDQWDDQNGSIQELVQALNNLPWRQREAIYLRYYNGLRTRDIAEVMGVANQTVLNTLYQALKKIRKNKQIKNY